MNLINLRIEFCAIINDYSMLASTNFDIDWLEKQRKQHNGIRGGMCFEATSPIEQTTKLDVVINQLACDARIKEPKASAENCTRKERISNFYPKHPKRVKRCSMSLYGNRTGYGADSLHKDLWE